MIDFESPFILLLTIPWTIFIILFFRVNRKSFHLLKRKVSDRFLDTVTYYSAVKLAVHSVIIFISGLSLIIASAGPFLWGEIKENVKSKNVVLIIDGSLSMVAGDTNKIDGLRKAYKRKEEALNIAKLILKSLPDYRFALISFSGIASYHSPLTWDHEAVEKYLKRFRLHYFQKMGSNFKAPLEALIHLAEYTRSEGIEAIIISDGEAMDFDDYTAELDVIKRRGIVLHAIGVGTEKGGGIEIYKPEDVITGKRKPQIIKRTNTYRQDKHLKKIASVTGGKYLIMEKKGSIDEIIESIKKSRGEKTVSGIKGKKDLSHIPVIIFAILFFPDLLFFDNIKFWKKRIALVPEMLRKKK